MSEAGKLETEQCDQTQAMLAAYALGDGDLDAQARAHLQTCPTCRMALEGYLGVVQLLAGAAPEVSPPPELRGRIIAAVQHEASALAPEQPALPAHTPPAPPPRRRAFRPWAGFAVACALLIALLGMVGWNLSLQQELARREDQVALSREGWQKFIVLMNDPELRVAQLQGGTAYGTFWSTPEGTTGCLMIEDLPELTPNTRFQVWLRGPDGWTSAGIFQQRSENEWFIIEPTAPLGSYSAILVTAEPDSGSPVPSGTPLIEGDLTVRS
jgi:hypothetical protein